MAEIAGLLPQAIVLVLALTGILGRSTLSSSAKEVASYIAQGADPREKIEQAAKMLASSMLAVTTFLSAFIAATFDTVASFVLAPSGWPFFAISIALYMIVILVFLFLLLGRRIYELELFRPNPLTFLGQTIYSPTSKISDWISTLTIFVLSGSVLTAVAKLVYAESCSC